jgi:hypothetical protein
MNSLLVSMASEESSTSRLLSTLDMRGTVLKRITTVPWVVGNAANKAKKRPFFCTAPADRIFGRWCFDVLQSEYALLANCPMIRRSSTAMFLSRCARPYSCCIERVNAGPHVSEPRRTKLSTKGDARRPRSLWFVKLRTESRTLNER